MRSKKQPRLIFDKKRKKEKKFYHNKFVKLLILHEIVRYFLNVPCIIFFCQ